MRRSGRKEKKYGKNIIIIYLNNIPKIINNTYSRLRTSFIFSRGSVRLSAALFFGVSANIPAPEITKCRQHDAAAVKHAVITPAPDGTGREVR